MKQRIFGLISALIGIVIALAAIELTAILWLYLEEGRYVSAEELFQRTQNTYVRDSTKGTNCRYVDTLYPHPYLAFVHHGNPPCGLPNVNNIGLLNTDFPTVKRDVTAAFGHRRKRLANSVELSGLATRKQAVAALEAIGRDPSARAEELAPPEFVLLAEALAR